MFASLAQPNSKPTEKLAPDFGVKIQGQKLQSKVIAVVVSEEINVPSMFALTLANWSPDQQDWTDNSLLDLGNSVEILMGYKGNKTSLMEGEITSLEPEFAQGEVPVLVVRGYDYSHRLLRGCKTRSFSKKKDSDIASDIAQGVGLSYGGPMTRASLDYVLQHNQTDMEFLQSRARRLGYEVVVRGKTLSFRPYQHTAKPVFTLSQKKDLLAFYGRLAGLSQVGTVKVQGWNPKNKQPIIGTAKPQDPKSGARATDRAFGSETTHLISQPLINQAEADQVALGTFNTMSLAYITGEGTCMGRTDLRAGIVIELKGAGKRFNGPYYVTSTTHSYSPKRGYRTAFTVRRHTT